MESPCPLTGHPGRAIRIRQPDELFSSFGSYYGKSLPEHLRTKYFTQPVYEFESRHSGLRWYRPAKLGDSDFYGKLAELFEWYYLGDTWDKTTAIGLIKLRPSDHVLEIGCGNGAFLRMLKKSGIACTGLDINESAIAQAQAAGLPAFTSAQQLPQGQKIGTLCLFQTIEHVDQPVEFLKTFVDQFQPAQIILSAPCHESLLGYTNDPLSWPPHHATAWSAKAFDHLARRIGYKVTHVDYNELEYSHFEYILSKHNRKLFRLPRIPKGRLSWWCFSLGKKLGLPWATRTHSILVQLERLNDS